MPVEVDILEDSIFQLSPELLNTLLKDHTTGKADMQRNIFWATSDYEHIGKEYQYNSPILPHLIIGDNGHIIMPRVLKSRDTQSIRSRDMAEVFTPSWICNAQNNLIDEVWFGRNDVFNTEYANEQGPINGNQRKAASYFRRVKLGRTMYAISDWKSLVEKPHT